MSHLFWLVAIWLLLFSWHPNATNIQLYMNTIFYRSVRNDGLMAERHIIDMIDSSWVVGVGWVPTR